MIFRPTRQMRCDKGMVDTPLVLPIHKWPCHLSFCNVYRVTQRSVLFRPISVWPFLYSVNHSLSMLSVLYIMCTYHHKCLLRLGRCYLFHHSNLLSVAFVGTHILCRQPKLVIHPFFLPPPPLGNSFAIISGRNFLKVVDTVTFVTFQTRRSDPD